MGKRRSRWCENTYLRYLEEGRGQGSGKDYKPWIYIQDFPSQGVCSRIYSEKTGRIHHLLSRNEEHFFHIIINDPDVIDVREQFPLRLSETLDIANKLGVRHPKIGNFPFVLTSDFFIVRKDRIQVRTIKMVSELEKLRVREKFSIEYTYWKSKSIEWKIITENEINVAKALNYKWLNESPLPCTIIEDRHVLDNCEELFMKLYFETDIPFTSICSGLEEHYMLPSGTGLLVFKSRVLSGKIPLDLSLPIDPVEPRVSHRR